MLALFCEAIIVLMPINNRVMRVQSKMYLVTFFICSETEEADNERMNLIEFEQFEYESRMATDVKSN